MKKIALCFIVFITISTTMSAQIDIQQFNKVGPEAVSALLGNPPEQWRDDVYPDCLILGEEAYHNNTCSFNARICLNDVDYRLVGFATKSSVYPFLLSFIPEGVKVGDPISKVESYDFVHTRYGRSKSGNALTQSGSYTDKTGELLRYYWLFSEELQRLHFLVNESDIIVEIGFSEPVEVPPYPDYDYTNLLIM